MKKTVDVMSLVFAWLICVVPLFFFIGEHWLVPVAIASQTVLTLAYGTWEYFKFKGEKNVRTS